MIPREAFRTKNFSITGGLEVAVARPRYGPKIRVFPQHSRFWGLFPTFFVNIYEVPYDLKNDQKKFWPTQKLPSVERFSVLLNSEKSIF